MKDKEIRYTISKNDMSVMLALAYALGVKNETHEDAMRKLEQHFQVLVLSRYVTSNEPEDEEE